jgi:BlaI family penicillinase repressor
MVKRSPSVRGMELAVLTVLWECGPCTIREITERLYPAGGAAQYATVQKLLERLEEKKCVRRDRSARAHRFWAVVDREQYLADRLRELAEKVCGGSFAPLLSSLVRVERLSTEEREVLKQLVQDIEERSGGRPSRRS